MAETSNELDRQVADAYDGYCLELHEKYRSSPDEELPEDLFRGGFMAGRMSLSPAEAGAEAMRLRQFVVDIERTGVCLCHAFSNVSREIGSKCLYCRAKKALRGK